MEESHDISAEVRALECGDVVRFKAACLTPGCEKLHEVKSVVLEREGNSIKLSNFASEKQPHRIVPMPFSYNITEVGIVKDQYGREIPVTRTEKHAGKRILKLFRRYKRLLKKGRSNPFLGRMPGCSNHEKCLVVASLVQSPQLDLNVLAYTLLLELGVESPSEEQVFKMIALVGMERFKREMAGGTGLSDLLSGNYVGSDN